MKTTIFIIIALLLLASCSTRQKHECVCEKNRLKTILPDTLYDFFPNFSTKDIECLRFTSNAIKMDAPYLPEEFEATYLLELYKFHSVYSLHQYCDCLINKAKAYYFAEDSTYFVIASESYLLTKYDSLNLIRKYGIFSSKPIILNFNYLNDKEFNLFSDSTTCGLKRGMPIYVIKYGSNSVLAPESEYDWNILPATIKHGYSCGFALDEQQLMVVFWVVAW